MMKARLDPLMIAMRSRSSTGADAIRRQPPLYGITAADAARVQPKLRIGDSDDAHEREADRVAAQVMAGATASTPTPLESSVQRHSDGPSISAPHGFDAAMGSLRGGGRPLPSSLRSFFESRFARDFSGVRVHTDGAAASAARSIDARAFTIGRDVVLGAGEYRPDSAAGRHLLAHELTHVVQQGGAQSRGGAGPKPGAAPSGVVQRITNKSEVGGFNVEVGDKKITLLDREKKSRGFIDFFVDKGTFYLKTIDTKSGKGPKGAGAILVYMLAMTALGQRFARIMVTNATPEETGFYLHMGFGPDPDFLQTLTQTGMPQSSIDKIKFTTLSADINTLLDNAGASVLKNWSDPSWAQGLYAGRHPEHGDMFHIPL
jgi:hypothetical protein